MNIVHLSETPLSASPYNLMKVQKKAGHNARLISHKCRYSDNSAVVFPHDILLRKHPDSNFKDANDFSKDEIFSIIRSADIIHCHNYFDSQFIFKLYPEIKKIVQTKPVFMQFHSPRFSLPDVDKTLQKPCIKKSLVVAQFQVRQFPKSIPVPNAFDIDDDLHKCTDKLEATTICYSPSNKTLKQWNNKGYKETQAILNSFTHKTLFNMYYEQCLKEKQKCHIAIDEVMTGSYHLCSLEALSHGQVAISGMDDLCHKALSVYTQTDYCPIISTNIKDLSGVLKSLIDAPEEMKKIQIASRKFMEEHWSIEKLNNYFNKVYEC